MQLDLRKIPQSGEQCFELERQVLTDWSRKSGLNVGGTGELKLEHQLDAGTLRLKGQITASLYAPCARCGAPVDHVHQAAVVATFVPKGGEQSLTDDLTDDDGLRGCLMNSEAMEEEVYEGKLIDLSEWLRDEWRLGLPLALRCSDDLCKEAAASDLKAPVDSRWAGLEALRESLSGGE
jgi:uncharacterized metal-binding protein YceD (DUF177 family)